MKSWTLSFLFSNPKFLPENQKSFSLVENSCQKLDFNQIVFDKMSIFNREDIYTHRANQIICAKNFRKKSKCYPGYEPQGSRGNKIPPTPPHSSYFFNPFSSFPLLQFHYSFYLTSSFSTSLLLLLLYSYFSFSHSSTPILFFFSLHFKLLTSN